MGKVAYLQTAGSLTRGSSQDILLSSAAQEAAILARVKTIKTHADALAYMQEVQEKVREKRAAVAV